MGSDKEQIVKKPIEFPESLGKIAPTSNDGCWGVHTTVAFYTIPAMAVSIFS